MAQNPEIFDWLRLARTQRIGPVTFASLIARFGSAGAALDALPRMAARGGGKAFDLAAPDTIKREIDTVAKLGGHIIAGNAPDFPAGLAALDAPPPVITVLGHVHLLRKDMVAMVGARNASALGRAFAAQMAQGLGDAGLVVASGLARGIDAAAHEAALATGTVAVVAGGIDIIYPPENEKLYGRIREQGAIVSEMPPGEAPQARHFPRRNRLISGLARGVVVVEAAERSGSLITAQYALEQGREIFAVPGSPLDARARGANRLIREGAMLVQSAADVLEQLTPMLGGTFGEPERGVSNAAPTTGLEEEADRIRALVEERLGPAPVGIDELIRQCGAPAAAVLTVILELELAGRCARHPGNGVSWLRPRAAIWAGPGPWPRHGPVPAGGPAAPGPGDWQFFARIPASLKCSGLFPAARGGRRRERDAEIGDFAGERAWRWIRFCLPSDYSRTWLIYNL